MSDTALPNGSAGEAAAAPPAPAIHDEASAMSALRGLLSPDADTGDSPAEANESPPAQADDDAGSEEAPTTGQEDDEERQPVPAEAEAPPPAVPPPSSWSSEDAAVFQKLPPDAQAVIARRESERDRDYHAKTQEIAAERSAIGQAQDTYARSLQQLLALTVPDLQQLQNLDWQRLSVEQPAEYVRLSAHRDALRQRVDALQGEQQRLAQQQQAIEAQQRAEIIAQQRQVLVQRVPEFRDPQKAQKLTADLTQAAAHYGIRPEELAGVIDARQIEVMRDAMQWRNHVANRAAAEQKRTPAPAPTMQRAGTPAQTNNTERRLQNKMSALKSTGSTKDAASVIKELLR